MIRWDSSDPNLGIATIDRPARRNALDADLCHALREHLETSHDRRVVVIKAEGPAFSAGADLARRADDTGGGLVHGGADSFRPAFEGLLDAIVEHPAPVIAALQGPALGAGMQLAVACDLRVAGRAARLGIPAARLGVVLSAANIERLAALGGLATARDLLLTGRVIEASEAVRLGLVDRLVEDPVAGALDLASELAASAPLTLRAHKRALHLVATARALSPEARDELAALEAQAFASDDLQEGLAAFAERRLPSFRGR